MNTRQITVKSFYTISNTYKHVYIFCEYNLKYIHILIAFNPIELNQATALFF